MLGAGQLLVHKILLRHFNIQQYDGGLVEVKPYERIGSFSLDSSF